MKASLPFAFPAAFAAFLVLPVAFEIGAAILGAAGFLAIAWFDYTRGPLRRVADTDRVVAPLSRKERFGLAA
jgi:hypothetical protein